MKDFIFVVFNSKKTVFTVQDIAILLGETGLQNLKAKVHYYVKKGVLRALRRGVYVKPEYDKLELATRIYTPSYISLETVLAKEGLIHQYYDTIFAVSYLTRDIKAGDVNISYRKIRHSILLRSEGMETAGGYAAASKERAFLDTLYLYKRYSFDRLDGLDRKKLNKILPIYGSKALEKRVKEMLADA